MSIRKYIGAALISAAAIAQTGCTDDFLEQENTYQLNQKTYFDSDEAVNSAVLPLYNFVWYNFNDKFYYGMGDGRANNITAQYSNYIYPYTNFTETSLSAGLNDAWSSFYSVVAQADNTITNIRDNSGSGVSETAKTQCIAEARFMRGLAYWYIGSLWGVGIVYESTDALVNNYVVKPQPLTDVMEFAIRDMEYAAANLPESAATAGRVDKYSAYGMLSRFYLSMAGLVAGNEAYNQSNAVSESDFNRGTRNTYYLDLAKKAALKVINDSKYSLVSSYADLFSATGFDNNSESLFQLQWTPGTAVNGNAQSMTRFLAWSALVADQNAWGGATYCSYDLWEEFKEYEDKNLGVTVDDAIRRHNCVASYGEEYPEFSTDASDPYIYGKTENAGNQGANIKKYVIGTKKVNGFSEPNNAGVNTYMMRLAEVYLNYTEAALGNDEKTSDVEYFNLVRERAKMATKSYVTYEDIRHERRVEFAFEGLYWYDLVRRSYYEEQEVINYCNSQHRNASYFESSTNTYELSDSWTYPGPSVSIATAINMTLPMDDTDQTKNPELKPTSSDVSHRRQYSTVPFTFGEREVSVDQLFN